MDTSPNMDQNSDNSVRGNLNHNNIDNQQYNHNFFTAYMDSERLLLHALMYDIIGVPLKSFRGMEDSSVAFFIGHSIGLCPVVGVEIVQAHHKGKQHLRAEIVISLPLKGLQRRSLLFLPKFVADFIRLILVVPEQVVKTNHKRKEHLQYERRLNHVPCTTTLSATLCVSTICQMA